MQLIVSVTVLFDIPIARQILGFFYFTFLPGFIFLKLLNLNELRHLETLLFSIGFSIAFLMIVGLLINEFGLLFGVSQPLSLILLMIVLNGLILLSGVLVYSRNRSTKIRAGESIRISPFALLFVFLPILSIVGAIYASVYQNNLLLLLLIIGISLVFIVSVLSKNLLSSKFYPFALLMIAIAILFHSSLISTYIVPFGSDVPVEYFLSETTIHNGYWSSTLTFLSGSGSLWSTEYGAMNAMLSITILPVVYSILLKMDLTWIFKLLYPAILAFVPLGLYQIWQKYIGKKYAFISAFLFIAQETFYSEMLGLNRQIIAELFFVILLLVMLNKKIEPFNKMTCFIIFSFALVLSHYALAMIFLFFVSFALLLLIVLKRSSRNITVSMIVLFFVIMFAWYIYTSRSATFDNFLEFGGRVYRQLEDFFNPASRGQDVLRGLGLAESPSIWNSISRIFAYITQVLIVFGFIGLATKRITISIEKEYLIFSLTAMVFLAILILLPGVANTLRMTRFYHILLFFLAPLCVIGALFIVKLLSKHKKELAVSALLLIVLVPYFLFQTEFMFEITGSDSWSIPLSGYRMNALRLYGQYGYTDSYSVYGARWLSENVNIGNSGLYADGSSRNYVLTIYGMVYRGYVNLLSNTTFVTRNGVVYLSTLNIIEGVIPFERFSWNTTELTFIFDDLSLVYTNGGSITYENIS